jgi:hypothetical protein
MNNEIDTNSNIYNAVWKKMVDNAHITSAKEIHKQMSERNETGVQYLPKKKKAAVEKDEEEGSDDGSGSGEDVIVVQKKRRRGSSDWDVSVNDVYRLEEQELKKFCNKAMFLREAKCFHLDDSLTNAEYAQAMVFLRSREAFKVGSTLPIKLDVVGALYKDNNLVNSGALSTIRDKCTRATAAKKADKIKGKTLEVYKKLNGVIARQKADELEKELDYFQKLQCGLEEKKMEGVAYDTEGNLIDPKIVAAARVAELNETRPPELSEKDRKARRLLLEKNQHFLNPANLLRLSQPAMPSDNKSKTKEKMSSSDNNSKDNQDPKSQGDKSASKF